jgi:Tfp pilus assembly protein PilZ
MQVEHRSKEKRIEISRPVEIVDNELGANIQGYTKNLSNRGMRARFDEIPKIGDFITLEIALAEDANPVETKGEVIWCAPDIYGTGAEVGLRFLDESNPEDKDKTSSKAAASEVALLKPGQRVFIEADGRAIPAIVEEVTRADQEDFQTVRVSLLLDDGREVGGDEILDKADEWKPHPFRDVKNWCVKYLGPVVVVLTKIFAPLLRLIGRGFAKLWAALPEKPRGRVETFAGRLDLKLRMGRIGAAARSLYCFVTNFPKSG